MWKLSITTQDRILVVSPHPDDESIGCGGLLAAYGEQIDILLVTDGRSAHGKEISDNECADIRKAEFENALNTTKVNRRIILDVPDSKAYLCSKELKKIGFHQYTKVFIPNCMEEHVDHRAVNEYVRRVLRKQNFRGQLFEYEVWTPLSVPTHFLDISAFVSMKDTLISCYQSQLCIRDYHALVHGLNAYRGVACHTEYAEAYELISSKNKWKKRYFRLPVKVQREIYKLARLLKK